MKKLNNIFRKLLVISALSLALLISCEHISIPDNVKTTNSAISGTPTAADSIGTSSPTGKYELTYFADCETGAQCMHAIEIGCLDNENPCPGKPVVLFKLQKTDGNPKPPILFSNWSPDGQQIAVVATGINGRPDIFVGNSTGTVWTNITRSPEREWEIRWSPDGRSIAFTSKSEDPEDPVKVYSISPNGENRTQLLLSLNSSFTNIHSPFWSPDGTKMVFESTDNDGNNQIFITNIDGTNVDQITDEPVDHISPSFSPDGEWILFRRENNKSERISDLCVIRPDGTDEHEITLDDSTWKVDPNWAPLGEWIAYLESDGLNFEIYIIRPTNMKKVRVTNSSTDESVLAWRIFPG